MSAAGLTHSQVAVMLIDGALAHIAGNVRGEVPIKPEPVVDLDRALAHEEQATEREDQPLAGDLVAEDPEQGRGQLHDPREREQEQVFYVQDNGIGIEPRYHQQVFGLFEKLEANGEGTGIGLALVKRIVEVHGGRVWVESQGAGQGATFCFTLPEPS